MKDTIRYRIFLFVINKILNVKHNEFPPIWIVWIFYPIISYWRYKYPNKNIAVDIVSLNYIIHGQRYPRTMFEDLSKYSKDGCYYILDCDKNNDLIIIRHLRDKNK